MESNIQEFAALGQFQTGLPSFSAQDLSTEKSFGHESYNPPPSTEPVGWFVNMSPYWTDNAKQKFL